jgi:DNA-binding response OmpR family regulator
MPQPGEPASLATFRDGDLHFDFAARLVIYDVRPASLRNRVELTRDEAAVLAVLIEHRHERPFWGPRLSELAWGSTDDEAAKKSMNVIARLQFKLGQTDLPRCPVELAPGVGCWYRMLHP